MYLHLVPLFFGALFIGQAVAAPASIAASSSIAAPFTLEQAIAKTAAVHPQLRAFAARAAVLEAERQVAGFAPPLRAEFEIENALGDTPYAATDSAEFTLSLAGVLERGGKRESRVALAVRRIDALGVERAIAELDVLAELARRYLDWLEAVHAQPLIDAAAQRQQKLAESLQARFRMGASPRALALAAEAEWQRLEADRVRAQSRIRSTWQALALMWGESVSASPQQAPVLPDAPPQLQSLQVLMQGLRATPDIEFFASLERIAEAEMQLVETRRRRDIEWQLGVRRLNADSANALVAGFSLPLSSRSRVDAEWAVEQRKKRQIGSEREVAMLALETALLRTHATIEEDIASRERLASEILPRLREAAAQGAKALSLGAITYADQAQLQREVLAAEREKLSLDVEIRRQLIELQRLTGQPLLVASNTSVESP